MSTKVAVVTGANKGIGLAIVRGLCQRFQGAVYLTSRNEQRGAAAVAALEREGLHPRYHQLDITDTRSLETFRDYIKKNYDGIDILINNAGILFKSSSAKEPLSVQAEQTLFVNYFSLVSSCDILLPIVKNGGRVINISSSLGHLSRIPSEELRNRLKDENLTVTGLSALMQQYVDAVKQGTQAADWGNSSYAVSKVGVSALTNIQQRMLNSRDIKVNSVYPGYVATDMSSFEGPMTPDEGAVAPLYLALDAPDTIKGKYVCARAVQAVPGRRVPDLAERAARRRAAVAALEREGLHPRYHQLDITDTRSLETFRDYIKKNYEGIDILVNNAGIAFGRNATDPVAVQAEQTLHVNYFALVTTCDILFPVLKNGARVVNISSSYAHLSNIPSHALRDRLKDEKLTVAGLSALMQEYVDAAKQGTHAADWGNSSLVVAKVGVTALSNIHQRMYMDRDEGAAAPLYVALDAPDSLRGQLVWFNKEIVSWDGVKPDREY
ncbi:hypothetical protein HF086_017579 [Spodoptera exigua]|uniref:carbonyl reductase (NADPH) n=1 Tax=Spodoptera exigua TaxID=7107 RepID=A0A922SHE1_SPOEX|nr:hypothetical protein HF086_017579 [Spodoptera exigua]